LSLLIIFCLFLSADSSRPLVHRQLAPIIPSQCLSQCSPLIEAIASCTDDQCLCPTLVSQGPPCTSCVASYTADVATALGAGIPVCQSENLTSSTPSECSSQCSRITQAALVCIDDSCYCPILLADGPQCSECWASDNIASANFYGSQITGCRSELATLPSATQTSLPPLFPCMDYCNPINQAAATCTDNACFCPIIIAQGPYCSQCWAPYNTAEASVVASFLSQCQSEILP